MKIKIPAPPPFALPIAAVLPIAAAIAACGVTSSQADLIGFYSFDERADPLADESGNGNHLTIAAGTDPIWGAAAGFNASGAYEFSGDRLLAPIDVNPAAMAQMTWGAWVRTSSVDSGLRKILGHDNGAWDRTLGLDNRNPNGNFRYTAFTGDNAVNASGPVEGTPAPLNTVDWTFIAASHDEVGKTIAVYIDLDASTQGDPLFSISEPAGFGVGFSTFAIGGIRPDNASEAWAGAIDNVFVYDELLDEFQLTAIRNGGKQAIIGIPGDPNLLVSAVLPLFGDLRSLGAGPGPIVRAVTLKNSAQVNDLVVSAIAISGPDAAFYAPDTTAPITIPPGVEIQLEITLTPPVQGGSFAATLEIASNDDDTPNISIPLNALIRSDPNIEIIAPTPVFGVLHEPIPATRTVTLLNSGVARDLAISDVRVTGTHASNYTPGAAPTSIAPGATAEISVSFDDGATPGAFFATLEIDSDDGDTPTASHSLDATSLMPTPAGGLIAFYAFDNAANTLEDASGITGDATVGGGAPVFDGASGFEGGGYQFNGADWLTVPLDINPGVMPHMTLGAWVRPDSVASGLRKVMGHDDGAWDRVIGLDERTAAGGGAQVQPAFRYSAFTGTSGNGPVQFTPTPTNTEDYSFLAASYDETNALVAVYVDLDAATTDDPLDKTTAPTLMGAGQTTLAIGAIRPDNGSEGWLGWVDNAFIFDGVLSDSEIKNLRDRGKAAFFGPGNFRITEIVRNPDGTVTLTWNSDANPGTNYAVRFNTDLAAPLSEWPDDDDGVPTGGDTTTYTTGNVFTQDRVFFVVEKN